jgi:RimJ/RimL family protein N-acetyltransferase
VVSTRIKPYWEGHLVRLRGVEPSDAIHHALLNRERDTDRNLDAVMPPASMAHTERWAREMSGQGFRDGDAFFFEIEELVTGETVGSIDTHHCDTRTGTFSYGVSLRQQFRRRGYASEAILLVLRYFFLERRYQKCDVGAFSFNVESQRLHEKLGFTLEGRRRRNTFSGGKYHDLLLYGMTAEEFRELHPGYGESEPGRG